MTKLERLHGVVKLDLKGTGLRLLPAFGGNAWSWNLGPAHLLVTCDSGERESVIERVSSSPAVWFTDVTSVYAHFQLSGPESRGILRKLTSLNVASAALPDLASRQTRVAHVHAIVLRRDADRDAAFQILVSREYGESVWDAVLHAGHEFHLEAAG
jgi:sarcosine oxidase subunit alpha